MSIRLPSDLATENEIRRVEEKNGRAKEKEVDQVFLPFALVKTWEDCFPILFIERRCFSIVYHTDIESKAAMAVVVLVPKRRLSLLYWLLASLFRAGWGGRGRKDGRRWSIIVIAIAIRVARKQENRRRLVESWQARQEKMKVHHPLGLIRCHC